MRTAVIGIGSNSVRMLIADVNDGKMDRILRDREGTRLFAGLDDRGFLSIESMRKTADAVARMVRGAVEEGAETVDIFATSASRDAANGREFIAMIEDMTGLRLQIISGEEEASLSFMGATGEGLCGVIDIGGGSTELVVGEGADIRTAMSCQMGAVRLFNLLQINGPEDVPVVMAAATEILKEESARHPDMPVPGKWYGTGGTFTTLAAMIKCIRWTDRTYMHGTGITREDVRKYTELLSDMPLKERLKLPGLQPGRADIVVHGMCILLAVMEHLDIESITVSEYGNLDGYIKKKWL
ncbi:MAG: Ppx/GppA phosphatase family protein [Clostridia bacterium]|nr:Ppx/GppA phosphatase family protein [Clostridia bacterium]